MELLLVVLGLAALIVGYFCFGVLVKFLLSWWILALGTPVILVIGFSFGWVGAIVAIIGLYVLVAANNRWQGSERYFALEQKVDKAFYFSDT
jgi:uncharacterized membrane protein (DUF485 family)